MKAVAALAKLRRGERTKKKMRAFVREVEGAKNSRQRGDLLEIMQMKLKKAMDAAIEDVEKEEEVAHAEHGGEEAAAAFEHKGKMRKLTAKLMTVQQASRGDGLTLDDEGHKHVRKRALAGCTESHAVLHEENNRMLAAIKKMNALKDAHEDEHAHVPEYLGHKTHEFNQGRSLRNKALDGCKDSFSES